LARTASASKHRLSDCGQIPVEILRKANDLYLSQS
jgi:hypothetical protein